MDKAQNKVHRQNAPTARKKMPLFFVIPALLLLTSCTMLANRRVHRPDAAPPVAQAPRPFTVTDFRDRDSGYEMPEWVALWLEGGVQAVETLEAHEGRHVFVSRNQGSSLNALHQWAQWFTPELDFPRLAAARIEERFLSGVSRPDNVYGSFFVSLIRMASDAQWTGAVREDDFWLHRRFYPAENNGDEFAAPQNSFADGGFFFDGFLFSPLPEIEEVWEFLILVSIDRDLFASQLDTVFRSVSPNPPPTRDQVNAANRVIDTFFDGF